MSVRDSDTLENCDEVCVHLDDLGLLAVELKILFWTMRMKDNSLLFNKDIDSEFLVLISKENQSFKVEG